MKNLNIRKVDDVVYLKIKTMAAAKGRSMEAELRDIIIKAAAQTPVTRDVAQAIRERVIRCGGIELDIPPRESPREIVRFGE